MKTHAVKEPITDNRLYVEIDPQPYEGLKVGIIYIYPPPIRIGDTVYQGEEWITDFGGNPKILSANDKELLKLAKWTEDIKSPETMPIELADKTSKVVGVDVEEKMTTEMVPTLTNPPFMKPIHREKWFSSYKLEEIK